MGLSSALQSFGMTLTPMIGANLIEHRKRVLPVAFSTGWGMRGMILAISLSGLILPTPWSLWALMLFLAGFGLFQGMQGVIFNFLMAKVIPVSKRGRLTGMRNFLAGIISAMVAWLSVIHFTPSYSAMERCRSSRAFRFGKKKGCRSLNPQMNMSSVAREICELPAETLPATAFMIRSFGTDICGFRSGRQKLHLRPQPVVISITPKAVRLSGMTSDNGLFG